FLLWRHHFTHGEDMLESVDLQLPHGVMEPFDGGRNLWAIAVLFTDSGSQISIRRAHLHFQSLALWCEFVFEHVDALPLFRAAVEVAVHSLVQILRLVFVAENQFPRTYAA